MYKRISYIDTNTEDAFTSAQIRTRISFRYYISIILHRKNNIKRITMGYFVNVYCIMFFIYLVIVDFYISLKLDLSIAYFGLQLRLNV